MSEQRSFIYDTVSPLLDPNTTTCDPPCPADISLNEAADTSPVYTNKIKKSKKAESAIKTSEPTTADGDDEELAFLNKRIKFISESSSSSGMTCTVFRREISGGESYVHRESNDDEAEEYLSLDFQSPKLPEEEEVSPEKISPVQAPAPEQEEIKGVDSFHWTHGRKQIRSPLLLLHHEITNFCHFLLPTSEEQTARTAAVARVSEVIKSIWPSCQVKVFGSFETGLYLPSSDVDVVILNSDVQVPQNGLQALAKALSQRSIGHKMQVIGKARVPIVKFIEKESNVAFDISFDVQNGPEAAKFIKDAIAKISPLKPLCLILKIFLQQRELNEVYSGGIGSYALLVMLMTHLQMHWSRQSSKANSTCLESNLGILLIDFFDLYGRKLNANDVGVSCRSGGQFYSKNIRGFSNLKRRHLLSVEDPQAPENDIGKNSYNILKVRSAFAMAFRLLTDIKYNDLVSPHFSILGRIIRVDEKLLGRQARFMEVSQLDTSQKALRCRSVTNSDEIMLHPLIEEQSELFERWQLCDDEPLPRGGECLENPYGQCSTKKGLKRKQREERLQNKNYLGVKCKVSKRQKQKRFSKKYKKQGDALAEYYGNTPKSKKSKQITEDEAPCVTRHGPYHQKSTNSSKNVERKRVWNDHDNNGSARTIINSPTDKKMKYY